MGHKNSTIDIVKGIAIILVVYGHVIQKGMSPQGVDFFLNPVFKTIYTFHMPLFVFVSGYLMAESLKKRSAGDVFKIRCESLLMPFIVWSVFDLAINTMLSAIGETNSGKSPLHEEFINYLLINPSVWFLFTLFILSCLLLFSVRLKEKCGFTAFGVIYALVLMLPFNEYCGLYYIKWFYLFYVAGYLINEFGAPLIVRGNNLRVLVILLAAFVVLALFWLKTDYIYINRMRLMSGNDALAMLRIVYRYTIAFLGIAIVFGVGNYFSKFNMGRILAYVGVYSLDIYLLQRYIVEGFYVRAIAKAHIHMDFNAPLMLYIVAPLIAVLFVMGCIGISNAVIRRHGSLRRVLLGDRGRVK